MRLADRVGYAWRDMKEGENREQCMEKTCVEGGNGSEKTRSAPFMGNCMVAGGLVMVIVNKPPPARQGHDAWWGWYPVRGSKWGNAC